MGVLPSDFLDLEYSLQPDERTDIAIRLEGDSAKELILADVLFRTPESEWLTPASLPPAPLDRWDLSTTPIDAPLVSYSLPVIYGERLPNGEFLRERDSQVTFGLDIFGSAFFMLTRYEEIVIRHRDSRERFPGAASLAARERFLDRPVVNEYLELLWWAFERLWPRVAARRRRQSFQVDLSHDVDWPYCTRQRPRAVARSVVGDALRRRDIQLGLRRSASFVRTRQGNLDADICNTFDFIMDISERRGLRSSFYFITDNTTGGIEAAPYSIDDPWIRKLLRSIHARGHEIGLHTSYDSFQDPVQTRNEFTKLLRVCEEEGIEQSAWGGRQHYLRWENPVTWQNWADAGLEYDSTLTFAELPGFRSGVCFDYPVFNLQTRAPLRLRERPLVVMEGSLFSRFYLNLPPSRAREELLKLRDRCQLFAGQFTLLWHNNQLLSSWQKKLYEEIVGTG